jgi:hypothetical protein
MLITMEGRTDRTLFRNAAVFLVAAVALYGLNDYLFSAIEWAPLQIPVELVDGREHAGEFTARWGVVYEIRLDTDRNLDLQEQNCLLGIETVVPERCAGISPELNVSWQVKSDGEVIARGESDDSQVGYWGPSMGKILGAFQAQGGQSYRVVATVGRTAPELQRSNPRLRIAVAPRERKWTYVWSGLLIVLATCLLLLAIVLSLVLLRRSHFRRRD